MQGRIENERKVENRILNIIQNHSEIIRKYYSYIDNKTHNTKLMYINRVINFLNYLDNQGYDIEDYNIYKTLRPSNIREYMKLTKNKKDKDGNIKELSESYRTLQLSAIVSFFDFLISEHYLSENPCLEVKLPRTKEDKQIIYLTPEEVKTIKNNIKTGVGTDRAIAKQKKWKERDMAIIHLMLHTGLRVTALTEINIEDINFEQCCIRVTEKENYTRDIYIDPTTKDILKKWIYKRKIIIGEEDIPALFISSEKKRITSMAVSDIVKKYSYNINKKITPHKLRATFATTVYGATKDIYITSNLIGHSSIETTKRYAAITNEQRTVAINSLASIY